MVPDDPCLLEFMPLCDSLSSMWVDAVTCFSIRVEDGKNHDGMLLRRLGYRKTMASILGLCSHCLTLRGASCHVKSCPMPISENRGSPLAHEEL